MARAYCYQCNRAKSACLCELAQSIENRPQVYVLQHPDERSHPRGSAIIAQLCLQNYQCWVAKSFAGHMGLQRLLAQQADQCLLVYPAPQAVQVNIFEVNDVQAALGFTPQHIIFIDASWRKAKKIWHSTPALQAIKCMAMQAQAHSNYRIRKSAGAGMLSSIEAMTACLSWLDKDCDYQPMLNIFDQMIERQIQQMGQLVYQSNYQHKQDENRG